MEARRPAPEVIVSSCQSALRVPRKRIAELVAFVARREGAALEQIDVAVVGARRMAELNRRYLGHRGATDVLSFDLTDAWQGGGCGQIVVCGDVAAREARRRGTAPQRELLLYVAHGLLHLLGYDDASPRAAARTRARQERILAEFLGPARPRRRRNLPPKGG